MAGARQDGDGVELDDAQDGATLRGDALLVATGGSPNGDLLDAEQAGVEGDADGQVVVDEYQRTTARGIFALGDVSSDYQLKHVANHEARVVKHNLLQDWDDTDALMPSDHRYVPSAVFTDPQIAMRRPHRKPGPRKGIQHQGRRCRTSATSPTAGRWRTPPASRRSSSKPTSGLILGAHIMGHQASSLIQPLIQAMSFGLAGQDMARGQYWIHPALPEVIENALLALCGEPPWPPARRH